MNLICSIFFALFVVLSPVVPLVDYVADDMHIAEILLVKKRNPKIHSKGKYYLSKEVVKRSTSDSSSFDKAKSLGQKLLDVYILSRITKINTIENTLFSSYKFLYETTYSYLFLQNIFRPPVFLCIIFF